MSSSLTRETSGSSYHYQSDEGEIQCFTLRQYDLVSSSSDELVAAFKDLQQPVFGEVERKEVEQLIATGFQDLQQPVFGEVERKEVEQLIATGFQGDVKMYPRCVAKHLDRHYPNVYRRIMNAFDAPSVFIFAAFRLMKHYDLEGFRSTPKNVLFDVCVFRTSKPFMILTFVSNNKKEGRVLSYNSRLAKFAVRCINEDLHLDLPVLNGVLNEADCISDDVFGEKIEKLEKLTTVFVLPVSLYMDRALHGKVVGSFVKRFEESIGEIKYMSTLQKSNTDMAETENCHQTNCIYRLKYQKLLAKLKRRAREQGTDLIVPDIESEEGDFVNAFKGEDTAGASALRLEIMKLHDEIRTLEAELKVALWNTGCDREPSLEHHQTQRTCSL